MELLMEKIRSKASQYKTFAESAKALRMAQLEKRYAIDVGERNQLQKCLDTMQQSMKVNSLQGMVERLESISRHLSLKLMAGQTGLELFISSDMFYLEISLESTGQVKDVKVHHEGKTEQQSCEELVSCLSRGDFADLTTQLEGLISIYQLNAEKKVKCKAYSALCALESDLVSLWTAQSNIKDAQVLLNKSPVGILTKRRGGHPLMLTYFVSPYDVLEAETTLTVDSIIQQKLGYNVTICLESSAAHKLQTIPLLTINKTPSGRSSPTYTALSPANSATLPAYFVLKLNKPMPLCSEIVNQMKQITELEVDDLSNVTPMLSLITLHMSNGKLDSANNRGLFVNLPDQTHCYFMTECKGLDGVIVSNIPFTHPAQVPQILTLLRQQALFNTLIASSVRPHSKQDLEEMIMLEISALSWQHLSVSFEHPVGESMATVEIDLSDVSDVKTKLHSTGSEVLQNQNPEHVSKVLQRCLSIPVTMRTLMNLQVQAEVQVQSFNGSFLSSAASGGGGGSGGPGGSNSGGGTGGNNSHGTGGGSMDTSKIKQEPSAGEMNGRSSQFDEFSAFSALDKNQSGSSLSATSTSTGGCASSALLSVLQSEQQRTTKKRKQHDKLPAWRNAKHKPDDGEIVLESSDDENSPLGTPASQLDKGDLEELDDVEEMLKQTVGAPATTCVTPSTITQTPATSTTPASSATASAPVVPKIDKVKKKKPPSTHANSLMLELAEARSSIQASVTITPITCSSAATTNINSVLERRPGIEIIPIQSAPVQTLPSSITITPITSNPVKDDRKSSKSKLEDKLRLEKKRKRKREEESSKMGPPEKVPVKGDPLAKPVSVSIKSALDSPPSTSRPTSPSVRKYETSPTHFNKTSQSGKQHSNLSPKHATSFTSSPKHNSGASPKHGSPKSGTGKPSMSTLKSATNSPTSSKNSDVKKSGSGGKDQARKSFSSSNSSTSPKIKSSTVKLKQLDLAGEVSVQNVSAASAAVANLNDKLTMQANNQLQRNRKGSLSAVIDKLKSAQEVNDIVIAGNNVKQREVICGATGGVVVKDGRILPGITVVQDGKTPEGMKNPTEYMVKPSLDGMKITINKTRTKESSKSGKSSSGSGGNSPKTHTGLKPGVISGPASKKPHVTITKTTGLTSRPSSGLSKGSSLKGSLLGKSKSSLSPRPAFDGKKDLNKPRPVKSSGDKIGVFNKERKGSPAPKEDEHGFKLVKMENSLPSVVEGLIKPFDTKFQIPKLSARSNTDAHNKDKLEIKVIDLGTKPNTDVASSLKYQATVPKPEDRSKTPTSSIPNLLSLPTALTTVSPKLPLTSPNLPTTSLSSITSRLDRVDDSSTKTDEKEQRPVQTVVHEAKPETKLEVKTEKKVEESKKPILEVGKLKSLTTSQEAAEILLDFSSSNQSEPVTTVSTATAAFTAPKSPPVVTSSPGVLPSPRSTPNITEDDLMDEALTLLK